MTNTITAAEVIERFKTGQTDFHDLGRCLVTGEVRIDEIVQEVVFIDFGDLIFEDNVMLLSAAQPISLWFRNAEFQGDFTLGDHNCEHLFNIQFGFSNFKKELILSAPIGGVHLGTMQVGKLHCLRSDFSHAMIYAANRPDIAWVLQQMQLSCIQYEIEHAPPWMQKSPVVQS